MSASAFKDGTVDQIFFFGDSLTDGGGVFDLTTLISETAASFGIPGLPIVPPSPPYAGQFTNGLNYTDILPGMLGVDDANVINLAFGAAEAVGERPILSEELQASIIGSGAPLPQDFLDLISTDINLGGQLAMFAELTQTVPVSPNSAAFIYIGGNDLNALAALGTPTLEEGIAVVEGVVTNTLAAATQLKLAGVGTIVLTTLPAASFFPLITILSPDLVPLGNDLLAAINQGLKDGAAALEAQGIEVEIVDLAALADEIMADQSTFGFIEIEQPIIFGTGATVDFNPALADVPVDQVAFFDLLHYTESLHETIAAFEEASLTNETIFTGDDDDFIRASRDDDFVMSADGDDFVKLGRGDDVAIAGLGDDIVFGGSGSDLVAGGSGNDRLFGNRGEDVLAGGAGDDIVFGGSGSDALIGGPGDDLLFGGSGSDLFFVSDPALFDGSESETFISGGRGFDRLIVNLSEDALVIEQANIDANFQAGRFFSFETLDVTVRGVEAIDLQSGLDFDLTGLADGDLGARLQEADLFGFV
ncbi:MAG: SGNH/GDSL hydrolase family protein [Pseudomonadota bacterium]